MPLTRENFINQYSEIHKKKRYGHTSKSLLHLLLPYIEEIEAKSILDYGCGQSSLIDELKDIFDPNDEGNIKTFRYDPAIDGYAKLPEEKVDLVICTDVLEHIPCQDLDQVIEKILALGQQAIFVIATKKAREILPDGSNAHCSVYNKYWWLDMIKQYAEFAKFTPWPVKGRCCIITWDSRAVGGKFDAILKYIAGNANNLFKK